MRVGKTLFQYGGTGTRKERKKKRKKRKKERKKERKKRKKDLVPVRRHRHPVRERRTLLDVLLACGVERVPLQDLVPDRRDHGHVGDVVRGVDDRFDAVQRGIATVAESEIWP